MSYGTLWHNLHLGLHLHPFKVQLMHRLEPADHLQCHRYVEWVLEQQAVNGNFLNRIFFSNETYFTLGGYFNK